MQGEIIKAYKSLENWTTRDYFAGRDVEETVLVIFTYTCYEDGWINPVQVKVQNWAVANSRVP
jgi:hypothetical protein